MEYPLQEKIGDPSLFVGRKAEMVQFHKWLRFIPRRGSKSRVLLARRKSGKTAFVQRLYNQIWSQPEMGVIPFYLDIPEVKMWLPQFAILYFQAFASQYIAFMERDANPIRKLLELEEIKAYALAHSHKYLVDDVNQLLRYAERGWHSLMWDTACAAPHRYAAVLDLRFLVMLDEFQNLAQYIYRDEACAGQPDETMPGSFHSLSESKIAPMLVTGSYVGWLMRINEQYLEAGRLKYIRFSPYLTPEAGLEAVYKYAEFYAEPLTNTTAWQINALCMADPFFISCVIDSSYPGRDLTTATGVIETVNYEIAARESEMSRMWNEYILWTLSRVNDRYAKSLLLHLNQHPERYWTPTELKAVLHLDLDVADIRRKLMLLVGSDMIEWGTADIDFRGLQDGTLNLVIRSRFEKEINQFIPDFRDEFTDKVRALTQQNRRLRGLLNHVQGQFAEYQLANELRSRKRFKARAFFAGLPAADADATLNIVEVRQRVVLQRADSKVMELDVVARSACGRVLVVEVRKRQAKSTVADVEDLLEKVAVYAAHFPDARVLPAFLSLGDFTAEAQALCVAQSVGRATGIAWRL